MKSWNSWDLPGTLEVPRHMVTLIKPRIITVIIRITFRGDHFAMLRDIKMLNESTRNESPKTELLFLLIYDFVCNFFS